MWLLEVLERLKLGAQPTVDHFCEHLFQTVIEPPSDLLGDMLTMPNQGER